MDVAVLEFRAGTPRVLFKLPPRLVGLAATRDFQRFLLSVPASQKSPSSVNVVLNWPAALEKP